MGFEQVQEAAQKLQELEQKLQQGAGKRSSSSPVVQQQLACLAQERDDALARLDLVSGASVTCLLSCEQCLFHQASQCQPLHTICSRVQ